jgi:hypothetical protein
MSVKFSRAQAAELAQALGAAPTADAIPSYEDAISFLQDTCPHDLFPISESSAGELCANCGAVLDGEAMRAIAESL